MTPQAFARLTDITVFERGWLSSNNILLCGDEATALVDSGYGLHAGQTLALVGSALDARPLDVLANTHLHSDHCGGNAALQGAYPALTTLIPPGLARHVMPWDPAALTYTPTGQTCPPFRYDALLRPGSEIRLGRRLWQVHAAPGHDTHSVVLFEAADRILISADALWEDGFGILFAALPPASVTEPVFAAQRATLDAIAALQPRIVIPGHGAPFCDVAGALGRARGRLDYFIADPARIARNAAKVTLSFLLMIEGRLELSSLGERLARLSLLAAINRSVFGLDDAQFAALLAAELAKSRAATCEEGWLLAARR